MLSKSIARHIRKLKQKKYRQSYGQFVAEGEKCIADFLQSGFEPVYLLSTDHRFSDRKTTISVSVEDFADLSNLDTADGTLAVFDIPQESKSDGALSLILDQLANPGNLGTIIRTADWFGLNTIYLTKGSVDVYNPKVVQASMGSLARISVHYKDPEDLLKQFSQHRILVADLDGIALESVEKSTEPTVLVLGSESHGPSDFWKEAGQCITIVPKRKEGAESLNVAISAAILLHALS